MLLKILGLIDAVSCLCFLLLMFGITPALTLILFCAGLLGVKSLFLFSGDVLSIIDLFSAVILIFSIFFVPNIVFLWVPAFLLASKSIASFV